MFQDLQVPTCMERYHQLVLEECSIDRILQGEVEVVSGPYSEQKKRRPFLLLQAAGNRSWG